MRRIAPHPLTPWLALAFPGTFQNFFNGQNGFLSTALLGGGLCLLNQSPWAAGFLLGLVSYKPHLFALVPVALIAARRWQALLSALTTAMLLALASFLFFGQGVWVAFWKNLALPLILAREGLLPINKLVTIFGALLQVGVGFSPALIIQGVAMALMAAGVFYVWQLRISFARQAATLVLGAFLFSPYAFSYDLVLLALPLAWLGWEGYNAGWLPGEPAFLCLGWLLPLLTSVMALIRCQITPLILAALLIFVVKGGKAGAAWRQNRSTHKRRTPKDRQSSPDKPFSIHPDVLALKDKAQQRVWKPSGSVLPRQQPQCGFCELGLSCRICVMGPCRIDPFGDGPQRGVCGADADIMVARNLARMVAAGAASHSDHGRDLAGDAARRG